MKELNRDKICKTIFAVLLPIATFFFFGPINLYLVNINEMSFKLSSIIVAFLIISLSLLTIISLIMINLGEKPHELVMPLILIIGILLWLHGNILVWNYGKFDGNRINWGNYVINGLIDSSIWLIFITIAIIKKNVIYKNLKKICVSLLLIQFISTAILTYKTPMIKNDKTFMIDSESKFDFSKNKNVIIIVLDSFQTDVFQEIINQDESYKELFKGFTYYRNALGGYPFTDLSIPLILTGQYYENKEPFNEWRREVYLSKSVPKVLKENGYDAEIYPLMDKTVYFSEKVASNINRIHSMSKIRKESIKQLYSLTLFRYMPNFAKHYIYENTDLYKSKVLAGGNENNNHIIEFSNSVESRPKASYEKNVFKFYHLMAPHWPLILNENLDLVEMAPNRENYKSYAKASLKIVGKLLKKLEQLGIYKNSMIFIVGDHGASNQGQMFEIQDGMYYDNRNNVIKDRVMTTALPLVLAKRFNAIDGFTISDAPISLSDISSTIFSELNIKIDESSVSVFNVDENIKRNRRFLAYSTIEPPYYGTMEEYNIIDFGWLISSWQKTYRQFTSDGIKSYTPQKYNIGSKIKFGYDKSSKQYYLLGWSYPEERFTWTEGNNATMLIPIDDVSCNLILKAKLFPFLAKDIKYQRANIYVNGEKIANWKIDKAGEYTAEIPEKIVSNPLQISFELPDAVSPLESGVSEDVRILALAFNEMVIDKYSEYEIGSIVKFGIGGNAELFQKNGWSSPEDGFTWNDGERASITIPIEPTDKPLELKAKLAPFITQNAKMQKVIIYIGDEKIGEWEVDKDNDYSVSIPSDKIKESLINIEFEFPYATSPKKENISADERELSIRFMELLIDVVNSEKDTEMK